MCVCIDMCMYTFNFIPHIDLCNHQHSRDTDLFHYHFSCSSFYSHPSHNSSLPCPVPWKPLVYFHHFVILKMLYKWNYTLCNILRTTFLLNKLSLKSAHVVACTNSSSILLLSCIPLFGCTRIHSTTNSLKVFWVFSIFCSY